MKLFSTSNLLIPIMLRKGYQNSINVRVKMGLTTFIIEGRPLDCPSCLFSPQYLGQGCTKDPGQGFLNLRASHWVIGGLRVVKPVVEHRRWKRIRSMEYIGYGRGYLLVSG